MSNKARDVAENLLDWADMIEEENCKLAWWYTSKKTLLSKLVLDLHIAAGIIKNLTPTDDILREIPHPDGGVETRFDSKKLSQLSAVERQALAKRMAD